MQKNKIHINSYKLKFKIIFFIALMFCFKTELLSQSGEYTMKAVALEKISLFISWPENTLQNNSSNEFVIVVLGQNSFADVLRNVYKDKRIKDRKVRVVNTDNIQKLTECQLLYIPKIKISELTKVLNYVKGKPILTISDSDGFAEAGCFINFYQYENKLRFEINQKVIEEAGFTIDFRLLKVSKVINPVTK